MALLPTRDKRESVDLGTPQLYREDLEQITRIVRDECAGQVIIEFFDDRARVGDDPSAFADHHAQEDTSELLERLKISGERGDTKIEVSFSPRDAQLVITNPDNSARGAAGQIQSLCRERRRRFGRLHLLLSPPIEGLTARVAEIAGGATGLAVLLAINPELFIGVSLDPVWALLAGAVSALVLLTAFLVQDPGGPALVNAPRLERPSWWQRHRKDVFLLLVGGCIGYGVNQIPALAQLLSG